MSTEILINNQFVLNHPDFSEAAEVAAKGHFARLRIDTLMDNLANMDESGLLIAKIRSGTKLALVDFMGEESFLDEGEIATIWPLTKDGQLENELIMYVRPCDYDEKGNITNKHPVEYYLSPVKEEDEKIVLPSDPNDWQYASLTDELVEAIITHHQRIKGKAIRIPSIVADGLIWDVNLETAIDVSEGITFT